MRRVRDSFGRQPRGGPPGLAADRTSTRSAMRIRPRWTATLLSFVIAHALAAPALAQFDESPSGEVLRNKQIVRKLLAGRAHRLGVSAGPDPDTVYIGKSAADHTGPDNYWNIHTGSYLPGTNAPDAAYWDW